MKRCLGLRDRISKQFLTLYAGHGNMDKKTKQVGIVVISIAPLRIIATALVAMVLVSLAADAANCRCALLAAQSVLQHAEAEHPPCCCCAPKETASRHAEGNGHGANSGETCSGACDGSACPCCLRAPAHPPALPSHTSQASNPDRPLTIASAVFSVENLAVNGPRSFGALSSPPHFRPLHFLNCALLC